MPPEKNKNIWRNWEIQNTNVNIECTFLLFVGIWQFHDLKCTIMTHYARAKGKAKETHTINYLLHPSFCVRIKFRFAKKFLSISEIEINEKKQQQTAKHRFNFRPIRLNARLCAMSCLARFSQKNRTCMITDYRGKEMDGRMEKKKKNKAK